MPTRDTVLQLETLIEATTSLIEMKRVVDKVDYDIQVLQTQLGLKEEHQGEEVRAEGMEADESTAEGDAGEDGRAQSVASARSGRGSRKQVSLGLLEARGQASTDFVYQSRRSMSVSSVDTSARPNTKRQKRG